MAGRRSTSATIVSKPALPGPTTIAARRVVTGTEPAASCFAVSRRLRRCGERSGESSPSPPRYTSCRTPSCSAARATVRGQQVALFEVARSQGVHEVVGDLDALQGAADGALVRCVGDRPVDAVAGHGAAARRPRRRAGGRAGGAARCRSSPWPRRPRPSRRALADEPGEVAAADGGVDARLHV